MAHAWRVSAGLRFFKWLVQNADGKANAPLLWSCRYQCNLMVYAPGGYTFLDYLKFGIPLQIICGIFTCLIVLTMDYWWIYTVALFVLSVIVASVFFLLGGAKSRPNEEESLEIRPKELSEDVSDEKSPAHNVLVTGSEKRSDGVAFALPSPLQQSSLPSGLPSQECFNVGPPNFVYFEPPANPFQQSFPYPGPGQPYPYQASA